MHEQIKAKVLGIVAEADRGGVPFSETLYGIIAAVQIAAVDHGLFRGDEAAPPITIAGKLMNGEVFEFTLTKGPQR